MRSMLLLLCLAGCATPTPYQKKGFSGGYADIQVADGVHYVTVDGNGYTSTVTLVGYFHRRASELCGGEKYTWSMSTSSTTNPNVINGQIITVKKNSVGGEVRCGAAKDSP